MQHSRAPGLLSLAPSACSTKVAQSFHYVTLYKGIGMSVGLVQLCSILQDLYVDFDLAQETAHKIQGIRQWITNEYMHSGIRDDGSRILERLLSMARGSLPLC